jgi:hypothetical protein
MESLRRNHDCSGNAGILTVCENKEGLSILKDGKYPTAVWEDDAFRRHRVRPSKVDWMTLVDQADRWDFVYLSRSGRQTPH